MVVKRKMHSVTFWEFLSKFPGQVKRWTRLQWDRYYDGIRNEQRMLQRLKKAAAKAQARQEHKDNIRLQQAMGLENRGRRAQVQQEFKVAQASGYLGNYKEFLQDNADRLIEDWENRVLY